MSIPSSLSTALGIVFVLLGVAALWLMFHASRQVHNPAARDNALRAHRIAGYFFIALFALMTWFMVLKVRDAPEDLPLRPMLHILIAMILAPLLLVKVLIARYYKTFTAALVPLGIMIFTLAFVLIASTAGPYLLHRATMKDISLDSLDMGAARIDLQASESLTQKRCARCHTLDRVVGARKDAAGWLATMNRMRALPGAGISETDGKIILSYLISENSVDTSSKQGNLTVGKALVDSHCSRCHALDRTYQATKSAVAWRATVERMVKYAGGTGSVFKPGEDEQIIQFLSVTQVPEAMKAQLPDGSDLARDTTPAANKTNPSGSAVVPTISVTALIALIIGPLMLRRPKSPLPNSPKASSLGPAEGPSAAIAPAIRRPAILQLVRIERQTHDFVTLRFRVTEPDRLRPRPGQFLTFDWLIDGQKLVRSYSISSSPTQTGFIEITVKKEPQGRVSSFLNQRARRALTVEARGPYGRFCFDEKEHTRIVLIAGGSGITPIMSMLRYIDDLCLNTSVVLFYCVRSRRDFAFDRELTEFEERLTNFRRIPILTSPDSNWTGRSGRISLELLRADIDEITTCTFFLCGPEGFMTHVGGVLLSLGVDESRILREKFGGKRATPQNEGEREPETQGIRIDFAKSGKSSISVAGRTILETAELSGVDIPSSCRQGQCGTCAMRLLEGNVDMACEEGLDPALKAQGFILTCVARAKTEVRVDA